MLGDCQIGSRNIEGAMSQNLVRLSNCAWRASPVIFSVCSGQFELTHYLRFKFPRQSLFMLLDSDVSGLLFWKALEKYAFFSWLAVEFGVQIVTAVFLWFVFFQCKAMRIRVGIVAYACHLP